MPCARRRHDDIVALVEKYLRIRLHRSRRRAIAVLQNGDAVRALFVPDVQSAELDTVVSDDLDGRRLILYLVEPL